jgi:GTP-binding protein YchF
MSLSIGIVGLPNVGKSTLFKTLTKKQVDAANYPFCTIEPNVGTVAVPDPRLDKLTEISKSAKTVPTIIEFIDIAGLVKGASKGEGLGNKFLDNIRQVDAICHVIRTFEDSEVTHVENRIHPAEDAEIINTELLLSDLEQVERNLSQIEKKAKQKDKESIERLPILQKIHEGLNAETPIRDLGLTEEELFIIKSFNFLTAKPMMYLANTDETYTFDASAIPALADELIIPLSVKSESEIATMDVDEQAEFLEMLGREESGLDVLIREGYKLLDLVSFFTTGPQESKAWTVKRNTKAPQAAGTIHTDIERGFIMADVISYEDFVTYGGEKGAKEAAKLRMEGKDYIIQDGDVCHFKFNV